MQDDKRSTPIIVLRRPLARPRRERPVTTVINREKKKHQRRRGLKAPKSSSRNRKNDFIRHPREVPRSPRDVSRNRGKSADVRSRRVRRVHRARFAPRQESLIPGQPVPIYLAVGMCNCIGGASESLMRPAVKHHHRSSRGPTRDAATLRDLLIFEIARPGMFI